MARFKHEKLPEKIGIYKVTFIGSKRVYIGSSNYIARRRCNHISTLRRQTSGCHKLQNAFNKYGELNMLFEVIEYCSIEVLYEREQYYIDLYDSVRKGLNIGVAEAAFLGKHHTKKSKKLIGKAAEGNTYAAGFKQDKARVDHRSELTRKALTGRPRTDMVGEKHFASATTNKVARAIRELFRTGEYTRKQLSHIFNVSCCVVENIIKNKTYKYA